jgi:hypothetical protein
MSKFKTIFGSISNKKITLSVTQLLLIIGITIAIVFGGLYIRNINQPDKLLEYNKTFRAYQDTVVIPLLKQNAILSKTADSLLIVGQTAKQKSDSLTTTVQKSSHTLLVMRKKNQKVVDSLLARTVPVPCSSYVESIKELNTENKKLTEQTVVLEQRDSSRVKEITSLTISNSIQTKRADNAERVIRSWPMPPKPSSLFGIRVSQKTAFITGVVLTTTAAAVLHNNIEH